MPVKAIYLLLHLWFDYSCLPSGRISTSIVIGLINSIAPYMQEIDEYSSSNSWLDVKIL